MLRLNHEARDRLKQKEKIYMLCKLPIACMSRPNAVVLGDLFESQWGIQVDPFYVLTKEQIAQKNIEPWLFWPLISGPSFLDDEVVTDSFGNPTTDPKFYILNCRLSEEEIKGKYPALWRYLEQGKRQGLDKINRHRDHWKSEKPKSEPIFFSAPILFANGKFIYNESIAKATDEYTILYPSLQMQMRMMKTDTSMRQIWEALRASESDIPLENIPMDLVVDVLKWAKFLLKFGPQKLPNGWDSQKSALSVFIKSI